MSNSSEVSILSKWLEQKLTVYFAKSSRERAIFSRKDGNYDWLSPVSANHDNGIPIEAAISDFRILDLRLEVESETENLEKSNDILNDNLKDRVDDASWEEIQTLPWRKDNDSYKQRNAHVQLTYQEDSQSVGKELLLYMHASQVEQTDPPLGNKPKPSSKNYFLSLDEHQIDVYTQVFPVLKNWILSKNVDITLPVPECYYGCYESEKEKMSSFSGRRASKYDDEILLVDDDIMSKVAAGMALFERDKKNREHMNALNLPTKQTDYRLLIHSDVFRDGYKCRNVAGSTFLSLMNVEEALKSLAVVHSVSWAFTKLTGSTFPNKWPFLDDRSYLSHICDRIAYGYPIMVRLVQEYLTNKVHQQLEDEAQASRVMEGLTKLRKRIVQIVKGIRNPRKVQCFIHQDTCYSSFVFRYVLENSSQSNDSIEEKSDNKKAKCHVQQQPSPSEVTAARRDYLEKGLRREIMIINWRTASYGSGMIDVAFLLMSCLPPKTRRAETASLLRIYWNTFQIHSRKLGVCAGAEKAMLQDFQEALLYTCLLITGNIEERLCKLHDDGIEIFVEAVKDLIEAGLI